MVLSSGLTAIVRIVPGIVRIVRGLFGSFSPIPPSETLSAVLSAYCIVHIVPGIVCIVLI